MSNLGWLFYKDYFKDINYRDLDSEANEKIIQGKVENLLKQLVTIEEGEMLGNTHLKATTTYPGLILGSGNRHELPDVKGQAILGFSFDYTSGLPVIAGSSVKGVLRSAFKYPEYITELLQNRVDVEALEKEIFDNGDIFFDAIIISSGKILEDDYITPHGDVFKNPIPLRFIKVAPDVEFLCDFELHDGLLTKEEKAELFSSILSDLGVGAKTNVGYGKFTNIKIYETEEERLQREQEQEDAVAKALANMSPIERVFKMYENNPIKVILAMQSGEIEEYESIKIELAQKLKEELQKEPKTWEKAKQKALKRREFIETILK